MFRCYIRCFSQGHFSYSVSDRMCYTCTYTQPVHLAGMRLTYFVTWMPKSYLRVYRPERVSLSRDGCPGLWGSPFLWIGTTSARCGIIPDSKQPLNSLPSSRFRSHYFCQNTVWTRCFFRIHFLWCINFFYSPECLRNLRYIFSLLYMPYETNTIQGASEFIQKIGNVKLVCTKNTGTKKDKKS